MAKFLIVDPAQLAIMDSANDFSKCSKMYELIEKVTTPSNFVQALEHTNNGHVVKFIQAVLMGSSSCGQNPSTNPGLWYNIPEPIDSFCGREDFLTQLHDKLQFRNDFKTEVTVLSQVKTLSGLGGIGKTETATQYIMKHRQFYNNFIWIDAETQNSMTNSFLKLAKELKIPVKNSKGKSRKIKKIVKDIYNNICDGGKSNLIVFDNAEDYKSCKSFFPFGLHPDVKQPVILATSRNQEWKSPKGKIQVLPLDVLTDDESLEFILKQLEIPESDTEEFREESKEFIQLIGGLPLALQQAVAFIRQEKEQRELARVSYKIMEYVLEFKSIMEKFLSCSPESTAALSPTVFVTLFVTFRRLQSLENDKEYKESLSLFLQVLVQRQQICGENHPETRTTQRQMALLHLEMGHLTTSLFLFEQLEKKQVEILGPDHNNVLQTKHNKAAVLYEMGRFQEASQIFNDVYEKRKERLGENHLSTIDTLDWIADTLVQEDKLKEALEMYNKVYTIRQMELGEGHPDTINVKRMIEHCSH